MDFTASLWRLYKDKTLATISHFRFLIHLLNVNSQRSRLCQTPSDLFSAISAHCRLSFQPLDRNSHPFRLWISPPEITDIFTLGCLSLGSPLSFVRPPGSICRYRILSERPSSLIAGLLLALGFPPPELPFGFTVRREHQHTGPPPFVER